MAAMCELSAAELAQIEGGLPPFNWGIVSVNEIVITKA
jgi:bacteriocin-like protein